MTMSAAPRQLPQPLDRRLFALFVALQVVVAAAAFYLPSKLFAAAALWAGPELILPFGIYTSLAGGVMVLFMWLQHRLARAPSIGMALHTAADADFSKQPMPYGAAIAVGGLYVAFTLLRVN